MSLYRLVSRSACVGVAIALIWKLWPAHYDRLTSNDQLALAGNLALLALVILSCLAVPARVGGRSSRQRSPWPLDLVATPPCHPDPGPDHGRDRAAEGADEQPREEVH